ncbi:hypothetical protein PWT90_01520 [Aphanocladium album]|nr:hypothetical protein PWT90_01520 [Aphanocladium album]
MFSVTKTAAAALAVAVTAIAGDITYFNPGLGACGQYNGDNDMIVAVGHGMYDREHPCGRRIRAHYGGRSVDVTVVDRCGGCGDGDLDLSPNAFSQLVGSLGPGRVQGSWEWI